MCSFHARRRFATAVVSELRSYDVARFSKFTVDVSCYSFRLSNPFLTAKAPADFVVPEKLSIAFCDIGTFVSVCTGSCVSLI